MQLGHYAIRMNIHKVTSLTIGNTCTMHFRAVFQVDLGMRFKFMMCDKTKRKIVLRSNVLLIFLPFNGKYPIPIPVELFPFPSNSDFHSHENPIGSVGPMGIPVFRSSLLPIGFDLPAL
jgi:hypothetical protein